MKGAASGRAFFKESREEKTMLKDIIFQGLTRLAETPPPELGDRSEYVGASDIAGCARKAALDKKYPARHDLGTLIRFRRGHLAELVLKDAFDAMQIQYTHQQEFRHPDAPFRAHTDFIFESRVHVGVLEVKSTDGIPADPYDSWLQQLHFQMGLAAMKYPAKQVRGAVCSIDLNAGKIEMFNGYCFDPEIFTGLVAKGEMIWDYANNDVDESVIQTEKGPLCAWCHHRHGCPAFEVGEEVPEAPVKKEIQEYLGLKERQKDLSAQIKKLSNFLKDVVLNTNPDQGKVRVGNNVVTLRNRFRFDIDGIKLKKDHPRIYEECKKETAYPVLLVD
jgi:CRISPR-associated exonuclease Cas4